ncbi:hypothetical protein ACPV77_001685 [Campylobacter jejuni]
MKIGAVHCNPKIAPHLQHNDRTNSTSPNIHKERSHLNQCSKTAIQALKEIDQLYKEAMEKQKGKKGKKTPKERSYHEFIYEINENTTMEQCEKLTEQIAKLTGFTPLQISIHRDEGHTNGKGEFVTHYHAHAVFFTLDKNTGKQLARQQASLNPKNLSKIQDLAAETLQMQRGQKYFNLQEYNLSRQEKRAYKPQAPKRIQNQDDFKRFAEAQREAKEYNDKMQETALKLKNDLEAMGNQLKIKEMDLNAEEKRLNHKEKKINDERQKIESGYPEAFNDLDKKRRQEKKGLWNYFKNIITGGKHFQSIDEKYNIAKNAIIAQQKRNETKLIQKDKEIKKAKNEASEAKGGMRTELSKKESIIRELDYENMLLTKENKALNNFIAKAEQEALKKLDFNAEIEYLRSNSTFRTGLSELEKNALNNELTRRQKQEKELLRQQERQKNQDKGFTLSL